MLERQQAELPLVTQAELLGICHSSLYYKSVGPSAKEIAAKRRIDLSYTMHPIYGSRRMKRTSPRSEMSGDEDQPAEIVPIIVERENGVVPDDVRGIGEPPTVPTAAAVANAVFDAVGVRMHRLPLTPERVFWELERAKATRD